MSCNWSANLSARWIKEGHFIPLTRQTDERLSHLPFRESRGEFKGFLAELNFRLVIAGHCLLASIKFPFIRNKYPEDMLNMETAKMKSGQDGTSLVHLLKTKLSIFLSLDIFSWSKSELWAEIRFSWRNLLQIVSINWLRSLFTFYSLNTENASLTSHVFFWCFMRALITIL